MKARFIVGSALSCVALAACGALGGEFKLSGQEGIPPIKGNYTVNVPQNFQCGTTIQESDFTVQTKVVGDACEFSFSDDVTVVKAEDYNGANGATLKGANAVKRVEIEVTKFAVRDGTSGAPLDLNTAVRDLVAKVLGETVLTKADLTATLPLTKTISSAVVNEVKNQIKAQQPVVLPIDVIATLPLQPPPPAKLAIDFEGQPALVLGVAQ